MGMLWGTQNKECLVRWSSSLHNLKRWKWEALRNSFDMRHAFYFQAKYEDTAIGFPA